MQGDTPIKLLNVATMTDDQHQLLITQLRDRRLQPVRAYEELTLMQKEARIEKLEEAHKKQLVMFEKELERADRAIKKIEDRYNKLRIIKMEIEEM
tara:strand:+ start:2915 stop:3202 length:288 start_codon:yes stop_codon:yes gene_type:complete